MMLVAGVLVLVRRDMFATALAIVSPTKRS
jgi:hypothetical protein